MANFCQQCSVTMATPSCSGCECLNVPNIYTHTELIPCMEILEIPFTGLNTCICGENSVFISVISHTADIDIVSADIEKIVIQSVTNDPSVYYELEYEVSCGGYASLGKINGYTKDLCLGNINCDPCTGISTPTTPPVVIDLNVDP